MVKHVISDFPTDSRVNGRMSEQVSERISIAECVSEASSALLRKFVRDGRTQPNLEMREHIQKEI